jgi:hypothetical protein
VLFKDALFSTPLLNYIPDKLESRFHRFDNNTGWPGRKVGVAMAMWSLGQLIYNYSIPDFP